MCEAKTIADKGIDAGFRLRRWAVAALVLGTVATALNPVFVRLSDLEPAGSAFHRMLWALPLMGAWLFRESRVKGSPRVAIFKSARSVNDRWLLVLCGVFFAADLTALHWSIQLTSAANAILFLNAQPLYVVFGAWLLFGERVGARFLAGAGANITSGTPRMPSRIFAAVAPKRVSANMQRGPKWFENTLSCPTVIRLFKGTNIAPMRAQANRSCKSSGELRPRKATLSPLPIASSTVNAPAR